MSGQEPGGEDLALQNENNEERQFLVTIGSFQSPSQDTDRNYPERLQDGHTHQPDHLGEHHNQQRRSRSPTQRRHESRDERH